MPVRMVAKQTITLDDGKPTQPKEKPHPLRSIPGTGRRAQWDAQIGRWVVYRRNE